MMRNINITKDELTIIRQLADFDLTMLLSEIHEFGWIHPKYGERVGGKRLLMEIVEARKINPPPRGNR